MSAFTLTSFGIKKGGDDILHKQSKVTDKRAIVRLIFQPHSSCLTAEAELKMKCRFCVTDGGRMIASLAEVYDKSSWWNQTID